MTEKTNDTEIVKDRWSKNDKQIKYSTIKGVISELNNGEIFGSITLSVGHENPRPVNLAIKQIDLEEVKKEFFLGQKCFIKYYLASRFKNERWYTMANVLSVEKAFDE